MNTELQDMQKRAIELLKKPDIVNPSVLEQLARIPAQLQQMEMEAEQFETRKSKIYALLEGFENSGGVQIAASQPTRHGTDRAHGEIRITIDRKLLGLSGGIDTICERWDSDTLVRFLEVLHQALGASALEKLATLRVNRGPFISNNPLQDYRYQPYRGRPKLYAHKLIAGTGYSVLTHSSSDEKVDFVKMAWKHLGLPAGAVVVEKCRMSLGN